MALAILHYEDSNHTHCRFRIDIGTTNRFYTYVIGDDQIVQRHGLSVFAQPKLVSPLLSLPEYRLGRDVLEISHQQFDRHHRYVQLISYRTKTKEGPALSKIVTVPVISPTTLPDISTDNPLSMPFSREAIAMDHSPTYTTSFSYEEIPDAAYSESQGFFGNLIKGAVKAVSGVVKGAVKALPVVSKVASSLLPKLMPALTPVLGKNGASLVGQLAGILGGSGGNLTNVLKDPKKVSQIATLLKTSGLTKGLAPALAPAAAPATAMALSAAPSVGGESHTSGAYYSDAQFLRRGSSSGAGSVAVAPAMAPTSVTWYESDSSNGHGDHRRVVTQLLEHSLHPETLQGLMVDTMPPAVMRGMLAHGLMDTFKVIPGFHDALERVVTEEARATGQTPAIAGLASHSPEQPYNRVESVTLHFADIEPLRVGGRSRVLYHIGDDIAFPLELDTPRPITQGTLQILVKCPETLKVMVDKTFHLNHLVSGELDTVPHLSRSQLRQLKPNSDYLICAVLTWTARSSRSGQERRLGTSTSVLATLMGDCIFDRLDGVEETIALNDPEEYRPYWHKVWEGDFSEDGQTIELDCKYYYVLEPDEDHNSRMETLIRMEDKEGKEQSGKLKTGLVLSPVQLERLLAWVSDKPRLDEEEMAALACCEFRESFHQLARTQVEFTGDEGDSATLWVYPEMGLRRVVLQNFLESDANGQVMELVEQTVYFSIPATARFIGTSSA